MSDRGESQSNGYATVEQAMAELDRRDAERAETAEDNTEAETVDDESQTQDQDIEASDEDSGDVVTEEEEEQQEEAPLTVEFDGKQLEIPKGTPKAVIEAAQKLAGDLKADYTRKTQEVAAQRNQAEQARQALATQYQQIQAQTQALLAVGKEVLGEPPSLELAQQDPQEYLVRKGLYEQRVGQFNTLIQQQQQQTLRMQQEADAQRQAMLQEEFPKLLQAMPELNDPVKKGEFSKRAVDTAGAYGFSAEDVNSTVDHRILLMLRDLAEYRQLKDQMGKAKEKVSKAPPKVIPAGPSTPAKQVNGQKAKEAKQQFLKSGRTMKDVEAWIRKTS